jgi:hypothetical protein
MAYIYDLTDTWNASGTTFNGIKLNVTDSASASSSKLVTLQTNGTEHFSITKAGVGYISGNLGVGTTSPSVKFQIQQDQATYSYFDYYNVTNGGGIVWRQIVRNIANSGTTSIDFAKLIGGGFVINNNDANAANYTAFGIGGSERMRITSGGNVGIGTSSPSSRLTITGGTTEIRDGNYLMLRPVGNGWDMRLQATGTQLDVLSGGAPGSPIMSLVNGGNVGIGTSSPANKLDVVGTASARSDISTGNSPLVAVNTNTGSNTTKYTSLLFQGYDTIGTNKNTGLVLCGPSDANYVTSYLAFQTRSGDALSERMRIDSGGRVLIGTTATVGGTWSNEVKQTSSGVWPWGLNCVDRGLIVRNSSASSGFYAYFEYNGGTNNGSISWSGGTTSYNTTSDYRLKNINGPLKNSGAYIDALNPVEGSWKADGKRFIGLIAHQVQEVSQTSVVVGEKDGAEMQQMDYSAPELIANLIAEVQSLRARVAQLEGN